LQYKFFGRYQNVKESKRITKVIHKLQRHKLSKPSLFIKIKLNAEVASKEDIVIIKIDSDNTQEMQLIDFDI